MTTETAVLVAVVVGAVVFGVMLAGKKPPMRNTLTFTDQGTADYFNAQTELFR